MTMIIFKYVVGICMRNIFADNKDFQKNPSSRLTIADLDASMKEVRKNFQNQIRYYFFIIKFA